jgi:hypothetical protein
MVRPYVYDLRPEHSFVRTLRRAGYDVFMLDFGVPDDDQAVRQDHYLRQALHALRGPVREHVERGVRARVRRPDGRPARDHLPAPRLRGLDDLDLPSRP